MSGLEEYLSVKDFSEKAGVSMQSVYQRFNTSLKAYSRVEQGQKSINIKALKDIYGLDLEQDFKGKLNENLNDSLNESLNKIKLLKCDNASKDRMIQRLEKDLKERNEMIRRLEQQIENNTNKLHDLLENEQKILFRTLEQKQISDTVCDTVPGENENEKPLKKHWWQRRR